MEGGVRAACILHSNEELTVITDRSVRPVIPAAACVLLAVCAAVPPHAAAQRSSGAKSRLNKGRAAGERAVDIKLQKAREAFIREALEAAREYEKAGRPDKARAVLQTVEGLNPELPGLEARLKQLDEEILSSNEIEFDLDVSKGWTPRARVFKGREVRIQANGPYKFVTDLKVGPEGFPTSDPSRGEMAANIPCGALMAVVVPLRKPDPKSKKRRPPARPFVVGRQLEFTPKEDGVLYLAVNAPPGHRSTGKIAVKLSGYVRAGPK